MRICVVTISDPVFDGEFEDLSGRQIEEWLSRVITSPYSLTRVSIPGAYENIRDKLVDLADQDRVDLVLTTGGTGPSATDHTYEAMRAVMGRELPGFGEKMRRVSLDQAPSAILSRQTACIRGKTLIINLPGHPASIRVCLDTVFEAVPYCLDLIGAGGMQTNGDLVRAYRP